MNVKLPFFLVVFIFQYTFTSLYAQDIETIADEKPFEFSGSFTLYNSYYHVSGINPRRKDFSWYITGNPMVKLYGIEIPFNFTVSEQERSFRQPFNQFSISPSYKWVKLHLGYTNISWSPFTWAGQTALGAGVELNPGKFRFGFLYGRLNRAVAEDPTSTALQTPSYRRTGYATRVGFGTETSHIDLLFLKAKDDENSLSTPPQKTVILPAENVVVGLSSKCKFSEHFFWDADLATSIFTRDVRATSFNGYEPGFVKPFASLLHANTSTQMYNAVQSEFGYVSKVFKIKAKYKRVEPDFTSMGAYYFQTDVENITLEPSLYFSKQKLRFTSSIGKQRDNLLNKKAYTTKRWIGNLGLDWSPTKVFGFNTSYSNYSGEQSKGLKIPNQLVQQSYVSQNFLLAPRLTFINESVSHLHVLILNKQWLQDKNPNTSQLTEYEVNNLNYTGTLIFNKSALTLSGSYLHTEFHSNTNDNLLNGFTINANKAFLSNKLLTGIAVSETFHQLNGSPFATILNCTSQNSYNLNRHHGINLLINYLSNQTKTKTSDSFEEYNIDLGYTYTF